MMYEYTIYTIMRYSILAPNVMGL